LSSIHLQGVSRHYGAFAAVDDVSLDVEHGEFVTILGPSGSGKTTVLTMIAGLNTPTAGSIHIGGRDVTALPASQRNIGLVFQSYALFPHMTVFDNVAFPLSVRRIGRAETKRRVEEALARVRLESFARRKPSQLSGGQQQRVALARAIVFQPDILLLDEPLGALDRKLREEVQVELRRLQRSLGITTILVTHDQEEALSLSDRIVVLDRGKVQQSRHPRTPNMRRATARRGFPRHRECLRGARRRDGGSIVLEGGGPCPAAPRRGRPARPSPSPAAGAAGARAPGAEASCPPTSARASISARRALHIERRPARWWRWRPAAGAASPPAPRTPRPGSRKTCGSSPTRRAAGMTAGHRPRES